MVWGFWSICKGSTIGFQSSSSHIHQGFQHITASILQIKSSVCQISENIFLIFGCPLKDHTNLDCATQWFLIKPVNKSPGQLSSDQVETSLRSILLFKASNQSQNNDLANSNNKIDHSLNRQDREVLDNEHHREIEWKKDSEGEVYRIIHDSFEAKDSSLILGYLGYIFPICKAPKDLKFQIIQYTRFLEDLATSEFPFILGAVMDEVTATRKDLRGFLLTHRNNDDDTELSLEILDQSSTALVETKSDKPEKILNSIRVRTAVQAYSSVLLQVGKKLNNPVLARVINFFKTNRTFPSFVSCCSRHF